MNKLYCRRKKEASKLKENMSKLLKRIKHYWMIYAMWLISLGTITGLAILVLLEDLI